MSTQTDINISAYYSEWHSGSPLLVQGRSSDFATREEAELFASSFPKSLRLSVNSCDYSDERGRTWHVSFISRLLANGINGGRNETGVARYWRLTKLLADRSTAVVWRVDASNAYATQHDFERAIMGV